MADKKCKHGLTKLTCAYCRGYKPPKARRSIRKSDLYMSDKQFNHCFARSTFRHNIGGVETRFEES